MKITKKIFTVVICLIMLATSVFNEGWSSLLQTIKASAMAGHEQSYNDTRVELDFNKDWLFAFSEDDTSYMKGFDDSAWETVDLPHDFSMSQEFTTEGDTEAESGQLPGGTGWYRKWFNLYDYYTGDRIFLNFDGAYQHTYVYVNGNYVGANHYGYNSFSFEISEYLVCTNTAQNLIAVKVVNDQPNSRWYSGSGINRDVTLTVAGPVHVALYGPRLTTPDLHGILHNEGSNEGSGKVDAKIKLHNDTAISKKVTVEATILDSNHNAVSETVVSALTTIPAETEKEITLYPTVDNPEIWSLDNPVLYKLCTVVKNEAGELIDEYHTTFGYRCVHWTKDGFILNNEYIKLKGVCLHHDQGALGAAQEYEALYRQISILKDMGCNAIRTSHNPASKTLIEICNQLGMLVIEEFFDGWDASKNYNSKDFSEYFNKYISETNTAIGSNNAIGAGKQKWFQYVVEHTILRDEHDPCVIAWDIGNELCNITNDTDPSEVANYEAIATSIVKIVDTLDPSRPVLHGNNQPNNDTLKMIDDKMEVIGGNYNPYTWAQVMTDPNDSRSSKPFVAIEAASAINSRGVYYTMGTDQATFQCTSYDTNAVSWGGEAAQSWYYVVTNDWFSGEFIWTGFDYIGEPTPWNDGGTDNANAIPNSSYFGVVDTAGFAKDSYYLYRSWWNEDSTTLHLVPGSWNRENLLLNNGYVNVAVYSNAKKIELLLNGKVIANAVSSVTTTPAGYTYKTWTENIVSASDCSVGNFYTKEGADFYPQFSVKYAAGTLSVKAYDENGNEITDTVGSTKSVTGTATQIVTKIWDDRDTFVADGTDYVYVEFEARDADGNFMNDYNGTLNVKVDDSSARYAKIEGVDNGNPATTEKYQQSSVLISDSEAKIQMFNGKALVILRTTDEEGTINLTAVATDGTSSFSAQGVTVTSESESGIRLSDELHEVIRQSNVKYQPTLYDEYEIVKYHINNLDKPEDSGSGGIGDSGNSGDSGDTGESTEADKFEIYRPDPSETEGCIENGFYAINCRNKLMSEEVIDAWIIASDNYIVEIENSPAGSAYSYESFVTTDDNVFEFIHQGENKYYIKNRSTGKYLYMTYYPTGSLLTYETTPQLFTVSVNNNGSVRIYIEQVDTLYYLGNPWGDFFIHAESNLISDLWLYSAPTESTPSEPSVPSDNNYSIYLGKSSTTEGYIQDGKYIIFNQDIVMSSQIANVLQPDFNIQNKTSAVQGGYSYESFDTDSQNVFIFTHLGNNQYYIQNESNGKYVTIGSYKATFEDTPQAISITRNSDGSFLMNAGDYYLTYYTHWSCFYGEHIQYTGNVYANESARMWLYAKSTKASVSKVALYDALFAGIAEDFSIYTRESFEVLLRKLENGVSVYSDASSTDADFNAATQAIMNAIAELEMDIKKISGTLFKYGYNNSDGTADYSDGGLLMNDIAVRQMKQAILADVNLVNQIKEIIGYNDAGWTGNQADEVLDGVAEAYARIYTLQFTGKPHNNSSVNNAASNYKDVTYASTPLVTLWNMWTKANTHGEDDPHDIWTDEPIHDGASVQGLAGATLDKGVITSHAAYNNALSYANKGPNDGDYYYNAEDYTYGFMKGNAWKSVTLEYLSGISVYFPDLFTRENLDVNGNVTTATTGQFAKYYWDAAFPMFITTDEFGVNTYNFNSKDTTHLVQGSFDDEKQTVDMELNEVGYWKAEGPNSGSGFFPFNYKQGTTTYTGENAIYHYGFTFEHNFYIPKGGKHANGEDVIFNFSGDDDVYVYIDGVLVLDNGGLHGAREVTINFTNCTINYQYVMDVTDATLKSEEEYGYTYSYNKIVENDPIAETYNADTVAALNKLHEIISDGQVHTLNFFYLERGASDSNCRMSFNLSETSEEVKIIDQTLTLDYGLPVEYNITENNNLSQAALDQNVQVEYLGLCAVNADVNSTYTFELPEIIVPFEEGVTYTIDGMKYGTCTIDKEGNTSYTLKSTDMKEAEHYYVCARITGDPTYSEDVVYYQIEKTTFVPASTIYYEDNFETITYTDGKVPDNYNNTVNEYGIWKTDGMQETSLKQTADLTDSEANPYGYETNYMSFAEYSGGAAHFVDVSTKNNPNSKYSGGTGAKWPTVDFSFTGTGFDLISVTDSTTGAFSVMVKDENNNIVKNTVVDTFYGYNYGQIFMDAAGQPTLDSSLTPMYKSEKGSCTSDERYYDENGALTEVAHYYDAYGNVTETVTDNPSYAYAYGWVVAKAGTTDTLYQIPVIKITDLEYGNYNVTITPTFTSAFKHSSTAADGTSYYRVYLDAIRIYSPAGNADDIADADVKDAYAVDDELYPDYLELKDMLVGADSLSETEEQGIIFIDGIAALNNDIETYRNAGPNNELYLAKDQAVAFEIWATAVPTDIQIGAKLACGKPAFTISYASKTTEVEISTATDIHYSFNTVLPNDGKLTWRQVTGIDGINYYTTGTVVVQNTGAEDSVLSLTNLKWTFSQFGGKGYFRIPTDVENETVSVAATADTPMMAYSLMRMRTAALDIEQNTEPEVVTNADGNSIVTIKLNTSSDVSSLVITDENGNIIPESQIEYFVSQLEDENVVEWTVNITTQGSGTVTYVVTGAYENGYTDSSKSVTVVVDIGNPPAEEVQPDNNDGGTDENDSDKSIFGILNRIYEKLMDFFRVIFALFGMSV